MDGDWLRDHEELQRWQSWWMDLGVKHELGYGYQEAHVAIRAALRHPEYVQLWDQLLTELGCTPDIDAIVDGMPFELPISRELPPPEAAQGGAS